MRPRTQSRTTHADATRAALARLAPLVAPLAAALRGFLHGFVGQTSLPHDRHHACRALSRQARGRGRCC